MTIKEWFADNIVQIIHIAGTFKEVKDISYNPTKMNVRIVLKSDNIVKLEAYKITATTKFGLDVFLQRVDEPYCTFIYRAGPSIGQVTTGIELAIKEDSPMGQ